MFVVVITRVVRESWKTMRQLIVRCYKNRWGCGLRKKIWCMSDMYCLPKKEGRNAEMSDITINESCCIMWQKSMEDNTKNTFQRIPAISTKIGFWNPSQIRRWKKYFFVMVGFQWTFKNGKNRKIAGFFRGFWGSGIFKVWILVENIEF